MLHSEVIQHIDVTQMHSQRDVFQPARVAFLGQHGHSDAKTIWRCQFSCEPSLTCYRWSNMHQILATRCLASHLHTSARSSYLLAADLNPAHLRKTKLSSYSILE